MKKTFVIATILILGMNWIGYAESAIQPFAPDQLIVKLAPESMVLDHVLGPIPSVDAEERLVQLGMESWEPVFKTRKEYPNGLHRWFTLMLMPGTDPVLLSETLLQGPGVEAVDLSYPLEMYDVPNDPDFDSQWHWALMEAPAAWDIGHSTADTVIATIDTGMDLDHEDLADAVWNNAIEIANGNNGVDDDGNGYIDDFVGWDFRMGDNDPDNVNTFNSHGTHVAGISGAVTNNGIGVAGGSWGASLMTCKVFHDDTEAHAGAWPAHVAEAIVYAANTGANVINLSLGNNSDIQVEREACEYAFDLGVTICAASGNGGNDGIGDDIPHFPSSYDTVIGVGNTTKFEMKNSSSNWGPTVDVYAPGTAIRATLPDDDYKNLTGTSMSSPVVTGLAALIIANNPGITPQDVEYRIEGGCENIDLYNVPFMGELDPGRINFLFSMAETPIIRVKDQVTLDPTGNMNFEPDNGETVEFYLTLINQSWMDSTNVNISLTNAGTGITIVDGTAAYGDMGSKDTVKNTGEPLSLQITSAAVTDVEITANVTADGGYSESLTLNVHINNPMPQFPGFPRYAQGGHNAAAKVFDFDNDGIKEIVTASNDGLVSVCQLDGSYFPGWPVFTGTKNPSDQVLVIAAPAIADLDLDGDYEIIVGDRYYNRVYKDPNNPGAGSNHKYEGRVLAFHHDGSVVTGFPVVFETELVTEDPDIEVNDSSVKSSPCIADVVGDTHPEIIVGNYENDVYVIHHDGNIAAGWPVNVKTDVFATAATADFDMDGKEEIVIATKDDSDAGQDWGEIYLFEGDGSIAPGFPAYIPNQIYSAPVLADVDGDRVPDIIFGTGDYNDEIYPNTVTVLNMNGGAVDGFPVNVDQTVYASPGLGDLNGDGSPEIVVATYSGKLYAFHLDGTLMTGYPVEVATDQIYSSPIIADLDNQNGPEILVGSQDSFLYVIHGDGTPMFTAELDAEGFASPCVTDLENDGDIDIVMNGRSTYVWNLSGAFNSDMQFWPNYHGNNLNNGLYGMDTPVTAGVNMLISRDIFTAGDMCKLDAVLVNESAGTPLSNMDLFVILDVYGEYWFFPTWNQTVEWVDLPTLNGGTTLYPVFNFAWPEGISGSITGLRFWGALLDSTGSIYGEFDYVDFGYM